MFADEDLDTVLLLSPWKLSAQTTQESRDCQTSEVHRSEEGVQIMCTADGSTQTEPRGEKLESLIQHDSDEPEPPDLQDFLHRVESKVIRELSRNGRSHAFDEFMVDLDNHKQLVSCLHCLQLPCAVERNLHVTSISWNCTGSVIACAYGRIDDGDWRMEKSYVGTWNLNRRGLNHREADLLIDVSSTVTALCCHPGQPALIAGGMYSGEVVVWDTSQTRDPVMAQTGMSSYGHRDAVYQVEWVPLQRKGEFGVLSACSGGKVLLWQLDSDQSRMVLTASYSLLTSQVPQSGIGRFKGTGSSNLGGTSLALSRWDADTFLVGSEGGLLLRCSFSSKTPATVPSEEQSVTTIAPAVFAFQPHDGPIHSIHCSPFHRNLFLSAGTDGMVHLHSMLQTNVLLSFRVSDSYVFDVKWSPSRPLLFAASTGRGEVYFYDLASRSLQPAAIIDQGGTGHVATCLAFNQQDPGLLAVGKTDGTISIWQLSANLTAEQPREFSQLEQLANRAAE